MLVALALMSKLKLFASAFCVVKKSIEETETQNKTRDQQKAVLEVVVECKCKQQLALGHRESLEPRA